MSDAKPLTREERELIALNARRGAFPVNQKVTQQRWEATVREREARIKALRAALEEIANVYSAAADIKAQIALEADDAARGDS